MKFSRNLIITYWLMLSVISVAILALTLSCAKKEPELIKIGVILALTGDAAKYGESCKRGIDLGVQEINNAGGIKGAKLRVIYEDSGADPKKSVSALQKLITVDKVPAIVGPMASSEVLAIAPVAEQNKVVILTPTGSAPAISDAGDYVFRNVASDVYEGSIMPEFAYNELRLRRVTILYINNDFGVGLKETFASKFRQLGGEIMQTEAFDQGATDFRTQLAKIKRVNPDGIYLVGYKEMGRLLKQAGEMGLESQLLSFSMFEDPEILELAGNTAEEVYFSSQTFDPHSQEQQIREFVRQYETTYDTKPDIFAGLSYDAIRLLALAIQKGGVTADGIREQLHQTRDFAGVTGKTSFNDKGDVQKPMAIKVVRDGKFLWYKQFE